MDLTTVQDQLHDTAKIQLARLAASLDVPPDRCHLVFGRPETEIHLLAEQIEADLIVVGSHGRHGLALLLGSTSTGVLHGSPCDVLAVRVGTHPGTWRVTQFQPLIRADPLAELLCSGACQSTPSSTFADYGADLCHPQ